MTIAALTKSYTFSANTVAKAAEVNADFDELVSKVNEVIVDVNLAAPKASPSLTGTISADGNVSLAATAGNLVLVGASSTTDLTTKMQVTGSAKVSGNLTIAGSIPTLSTGNITASSTAVSPAKHTLYSKSTSNPTYPSTAYVTVENNAVKLHCDSYSLNGNITVANDQIIITTTGPQTTALTLSGATISATCSYLNSSGDVYVSTLGKGLILAQGTDGRIGTGTLSGGTVTIANTSISSDDQIILTCTGNGTNQGHWRVSINSGVGFTVSSSNASDANSFKWMAVKAITP